jgi:hypothetical protein
MSKLRDTSKSVSMSDKYSFYARASKDSNQEGTPYLERYFKVQKELRLMQEKNEE